MQKTGGVVVVDGPAAVSDGIVKAVAGEDIFFIEDVVSDIAAAFPFAGEKSDPVDGEVFHAVIAMIFHVIPDAEHGFKQFIAQGFGIGDGIIHSAEFDPPEILKPFHFVSARRQRFFGWVGVRP